MWNTLPLSPSLVNPFLVKFQKNFRKKQLNILLEELKGDKEGPKRNKRGLQGPR